MTTSTNPVTGATTTTGTTGTTASGSTAAGASQSIGKDDFLKLLTAQMQNQDPMQPTDNTQWVTEMAQFTQVEQTTNMATSNQKIADQLGVNQTLSLIGRTVTYTDSKGNAQSGTVGNVQMSGGSATLTVDGQTGISSTAVTEVQ